MWLTVVPSLSGYGAWGASLLLFSCQFRVPTGSILAKRLRSASPAATQAVTASSCQTFLRQGAARLSAHASALCRSHWASANEGSAPAGGRTGRARRVAGGHGGHHGRQARI